MNMYQNVNICSQALVPFQDSRTLKGNTHSSSGVLVRDCFAVIGIVLLYLFIFNCLQMTLHFFSTYLPLCVRERKKFKEREERERDMTY